MTVGEVALSTAVPSPHSLKVVIRCQCVPVDATMFVTSVVYLAMSRPSRGVASPAFQKPGLMVKEKPASRLSAAAGAYWCQESGWLAQVRKPANTFRFT